MAKLKFIPVGKIDPEGQNLIIVKTSPVFTKDLKKIIDHFEDDKAFNNILVVGRPASKKAFEIEAFERAERETMEYAHRMNDRCTILFMGEPGQKHERLITQQMVLLTKRLTECLFIHKLEMSKLSVYMMPNPLIEERFKHEIGTMKDVVGFRNNVEATIAHISYLDHLPKNEHEMKLKSAYFPEDRRLHERQQSDFAIHEGNI
ncbi:MAG: hypothetical protein RL641_703 [Candidatus Parcubacteria bacterium]|jgi:hypothetical protein